MIGIGITTRNRPQQLNNVVDKIKKFTESDYKLVIVDDASKTPVDNYTYYFKTNVGIPKAKNKCLELLQECTHIFLFDDDCYPIKKGWENVYINSGENHLSYQFEDENCKVKSKYNGIVSYNNAKGCMLYLNSRVLDRIGGFNTKYQLGMFEHKEYSKRIYNAGLTTSAFQDIQNSSQYIYSLDEQKKIKSTLSTDLRKLLVASNKAIYDIESLNSRYMPFGDIKEKVKDIIIPKTNKKLNFGVCISTHNRNSLVKKCYEQYKKFCPKDTPIFIVDDASTIPVLNATYRFENNVGIATAKNKSLELLIDAGVEHLFLSDDDTYPVVEDWYKPYILSEEPHLAHSWGLEKLYEDEYVTSYFASGGSLLYYDKKVIEDVGGMRTDFGKWGCEHVNLSDRIHNKGWTTFRYADVTGSEKLFYECDKYEKKTHISTATDEQVEYNRNVARNLWMSLLNETTYIDYRQKEDVIFTWLFTGKEDPQNAKRVIKADVSSISELAQSIMHGRLIVFYDELRNPQLKTGNGIDVEFIKVPNEINVYFQRWQTLYQYLRKSKNIGNVWAVDGTDVTQLKNPFLDMEKDKLYCGWEPVIVGNSWCIDNHPDTKIQEFLKGNNNQMLNPGVVGGSKEIIQELAHKLTKYWYDDHIDAIQSWDGKRVGVGDVPAFNLICEDYKDKIVTGIQVTTIFKSYEDNIFSKWKHK